MGTSILSRRKVEASLPRALGNNPVVTLEHGVEGVLRARALGLDEELFEPFDVTPEPRGLPAALEFVQQRIAREEDQNSARGACDDLEQARAYGVLVGEAVLLAESAEERCGAPASERASPDGALPCICQGSKNEGELW